MEKQLLKVRMLGTFSMEYNNRPVSFERNTQTKTNQLLQILFHAGADGIAREMLLQHLFGIEEITNPSNSLRATVFRLRKLLVVAGFPENDEFVHIKSGIYRWTSNIPVEVDVFLFERKAKEALETVKDDERYIKLKEVCELYGDNGLQLSDLSQIDIDYINNRKKFLGVIKKIIEAS